MASHDNATNKKRSETWHATKNAHENMILKVFQVKIDLSSLKDPQYHDINKCLLEAKWYRNYILNWSKQDKENNKIWAFDVKQNYITHKDKDMNDVPVKITQLTQQCRQSLVDSMCANIKALHALKEKGYQVPGELKFKSYHNVINYKQYKKNTSGWEIISPYKISLPGIRKHIRVNGLKQFIDIPGIDIANAQLIHKDKNYYVHITVYIPKSSMKYLKRKNAPKRKGGIGAIDFGCSTAFTLSDGRKFDAIIQKSEQIKRLERKRSRQVKGSKNYYKTCAKIRTKNKKLLNKKDDLARKLVSDWLHEYDILVIQDEQLSNWQKGGHGKKVFSSILGRVKALLKEYEGDRVFVLPKNYPTTKLCTNCGQYHDELTMWDCTFKCDCGVVEDRDVHAAKNMVWLYKFLIGRGLPELTRAEMEALLSGGSDDSFGLLATSVGEAVV